MLFKKQAVHDAWAATDRTLDFKIAIKDKTYTATDITNLTFDSGAMNGAALTIGSTYQNTIKITFSHLIEGLELLDEVTPQIGIRLPDGTWDFTNLGVFVLDSEVVQDRNNNTTTLSASDRMCMLGGTYESKLTYPAPISDIAIEVANLSGVKINEADFARIPNTEINSFGSVTYRDAIGYIAQFAGGFATFDRDGLLDVRILSDPNFVISPEQYQSKGLSKNESFYRIGGITCTVTTIAKDESGNETQETKTLQAGSSSGTQIALINPSMTQVLLDGLYQQLQDINFYPFSLNWFGDPSLEVGDWMTVKDTAGNEFKTPNLLYSLTFGGGLSAVSKADTTVASSASFVYKGQLSQDVENIRQHMNASGNIVSEGIDPPSNPKPGDIWFAKDGPDTIIKTWVIDPETGIGSWQEQVSTKPDEKLQESVDNAVKDAADALDKSNAAVENSNKAVEDAGFANSTANDAKASAEEATSKVADAISKADNAQSDATTAINNAQDALDKYDNLEASVETEITNINGELSQKVSQTEYNNLKGTVESNSTQITQNQHDIQLKANQTQVDTINKTVQNQQTEIKLNSDQIALKADQTVVDNINKTVSSNTAAINVNTNNIKLKANQSTVDTLAGRVSTAEGKIEVQAGQIAQTVSKTELNSTLSGYATQTWTQGQIKTTADNINLSVQKVQSDLNELEVGSSNLLIDSDFSSEVKNAEQVNQGKFNLTTEQHYRGSGSVKVTFENLTSKDSGVAFAPVNIKPSTDYVASGWLYSENARTIVVAGYSSGWASLSKQNIQLLAGTWTKFVYKMTTTSVIDHVRIAFFTNGITGVDAEPFYIDLLKFAEGNTVTDWSPAPEDMVTSTDFANLEIKVNGIQGTVANKADQSQVTQLADQITSTVSQIPSINLLPNGAFEYGDDGIKMGGSHLAPNGIGTSTVLVHHKGEEDTWLQRIPAIPNAVYTVSARISGAVKIAVVPTKTADGTGFHYDPIDGADNHVTTWTSNGYSRKSITFTAQAGAKGLQIIIQDSGVTNQWSTEFQIELGSIVHSYTTSTVGTATKSQITQLANDINLRVQKGDVINQINISPESILIAGQKVHITGQTTIDNAVIKDAMIANLSASKLTAGTIDAGKINVVNLNASNITTGTITGSNLSINLNTGEILFTKGSIKSANGLLNINVNNGSFSQTNASGDGIYFMSGELNLIDKNFTWPDLNSDHTYGTIDNFGVNMFDQQSVRSMRILGTKGVHLETGKTGGSLFLGMLGSSGTGADFDTNHSAIYSSGRSYIAAGNSRGKLPAQAMVQVGVPLTYPGSKLDWTINPNSDGYDSGKDIILESDTILLQADKDYVSSFAVSSDTKSGYLMSTTAYNRSYSSGQTATITQNGVFGVIVSAAKYKLAISDVNDLSDQAHSFLSVKPKQWFDKIETEEVADELTEGYNGTVDSPQLLPHYGYIAEDIYSAGLDNVTFRDPETGELQGIQYDRLIIYLHQLTKELYQRVNDLEAKIYSMEANK